MKSKIKRDLKFWVNLFTFGALILLVIISRKQIAEAFGKLADLNGIFLLFIIPLQTFNYYCVSRLYRDYFKTQGEVIPAKTMWSIVMELNFVNHVFPSGGVSGFSYLSLRLKQLGISTAKSTLAQLLRFGLTFTSFLVLLFVGMLLLALGRYTSPLIVLVSSSVAFMTLFGVIVAGFVISDERRIKAFVGILPKLVNRVARKIKRNKKEVINIGKVEDTLTDLHNDYVLLSKDWRQLKRPFMWAMLVNLTDLLTIYTVYLAFGSFVNIGALIIAYAVANFAGLIAILPGGVGIYEGLMTATLASAGVNKALALSATVVYRVLNMSFSLPIGYYLYNRALKRSGGSSQAREGHSGQSSRTISS